MKTYRRFLMVRERSRAKKLGVALEELEPQRRRSCRLPPGALAQVRVEPSKRPFTLLQVLEAGDPSPRMEAHVALGSEAAFTLHGFREFEVWTNGRATVHVVVA